MIVIDTNLIVYLHMRVPQTDAVEALLREDPDWHAPLLWRSEFRNVLLAYHRRKVLSLSAAALVAAEAEQFMEGREHGVASTDVLALAAESGCSAYDCEFVALARQLGTVLVTADAKLARAFPGMARRLA